MKKIISITLLFTLCVSMFLSLSVVAAQTAGEVNFIASCEKQSYQPGEFVQVSLDVKSNLTNSFCAASFFISFDADVLEFQSVKQGDGITGNGFDCSQKGNEVGVLWMDPRVQDVVSAADSQLAQIFFRVKDNAKEGNTSVNILDKQLEFVRFSEETYKINKKNLTIAVEKNNGKHTTKKGQTVTLPSEAYPIVKPNVIGEEASTNARGKVTTAKAGATTKSNNNAAGNTNANANQNNNADNSNVNNNNAVNNTIVSVVTDAKGNVVTDASGNPVTVIIDNNTQTATASGSTSSQEEGGNVLLIIIISVVVLAGAGCGAYFFYMKKKK